MKSKNRLCNRLLGSKRCLRKKEKGECPAISGRCVSGLNLEAIMPDKASFLFSVKKKENPYFS